jgi:hypothetical protein
MPDPGVTVPPDLQALVRARLGLSRQLEQTRCVMPHPCLRLGGCDIWFRNEKLAKVQAREDIDVSTHSLSHWRERLHPYCQTGNKAQEQVVGVDLLNLVTFLRAWPEAILQEMAIFIYNEGGPLYSAGAVQAPCQAEHLKEEGLNRGISGSEGGRTVLCLELLEQTLPCWHFPGTLTPID